MTQRTKLNFELNQPVEIELLFDEPVSGTNQYGNYLFSAFLQALFRIPHSKNEKKT